MQDKKPTPDDHAWEKKYAPKIGRGRLILVVSVYLAFNGLLAYMAAQRWFGALH